MELERIKNRMNDLADKRKSFLFGINFELSDGFLIENPLEQKDVLFRTPKASNIINKPASISKRNNLDIFPESYASYQKKFDIVIDRLKRGDSYLTNLTIKTPIETSLSLKEIFELSTAPYCLYMPENFICFSPERFVHISEGIISTNPMKGTINSDITNAENIILSDRKETAEHCTIVDLLRNDLGMIANNIKVKKFRYLDKIATAQRNILQVSSEITGELEKGYLSHLGDIIIKMLPAGSVSGAPKSSTINIIEDAEKEPRGYYTGIFGYFDGSVLDSAVIIRFIEEVNQQKFFRSGGGITALSDPKKEYNEVLEKIYFPFL